MDPHPLRGHDLYGTVLFVAGFAESPDHTSGLGCDLCPIAPSGRNAGGRCIDTHYLGVGQL